MIFNNPIFGNWYTDTVDIYRVVTVSHGNLDRQERQKINAAPVPCRIYHTEKGGPNMTSTTARERSSEKLVVRGGNLGYEGRQERYFAGNPVQYYDLVGGALTGLQHKEVGLLMDNVIGR